MLSKGQLVNEEHLTFVDQHGKYLDHTAISNKKSITQAGKLMDVLEKYDSKDTLETLKTDGENANTGKVIRYKSCGELRNRI